MKGEKLFWGAGTELTISYQDDGSIDHGAIRHMVDWQIQKGIRYLFVNGISSESYMLRQCAKRQGAGSRLCVM